MNVENLRVTNSWKEECKYILFDETKFDDWFGEVRTYTYKFELKKFVGDNGKIVWHLTCKDILGSVDGVETRSYGEDGSWPNDLSETPTGVEIINQLKDTFSI